MLLSNSTSCLFSIVIIVNLVIKAENAADPFMKSF